MERAQLTEQQIVDELRAAVAKVKALRKQLYEKRFLNLIFATINCKIQHIKFTDSSFEISYIHETATYTAANYLSKNNGGDPDEEDEASEIFPVHEQKTVVSFGYGDNRYYISGNRFNLYRSDTKIRIKSRQYADEFDLTRHTEYCAELSSNVDVPEYLAIKFFMAVSSADWSNEDIRKYFNIV